MFGTYVKMIDIDLKKLPYGTYSYCARCKTWFGTEKRSPVQACPGCGALWKDATGIYEKKGEQPPATPAPPRRGLAHNARWFLLLFLAMACGLCYLVLLTRLERALTQSGQELNLWLDTLGSVLVSFLWLGTATGLIFLLLRVSLLLLFALAAALAGTRAFGSVWSQGRQTMRQHGRLLDTAITVLASLLALLLLPLVLGRPADAWDIAIQLAIAVTIELLVVRRWRPISRPPAPTQS